MDPYLNHAVGRDSPGMRHALITPSDTTDIPIRPRALYVLAAGNLAIRDGAGVDQVYPVQPGLLPFSAVRILATGTTATVVGWW